jgi:hypothetical protein
VPEVIDAPLAMANLPVEVIGADLYGQQFFERTQTLAMSYDGVSMRLASKLSPDSEVIVRNPESNEETTAFVVGPMRKDDTGYIYDFAFLEEGVNLWRIPFPADDNLRKLGRELNRDAAATEHTVSQTVNPIPKLNPSPVQEHRENRRTTMKMTACVRYSGTDNIVDCEDISKGGFRFTSRKEYPEGTRVETAVPYAKSGTNIFSPSHIKYCLKMPDGQFRHGVAYIKRTSSIGWDP